MSVLFVPCTPAGESWWSQRTRLDGRDYLLTFRWSQRTGRWSLDIADADGSAIASGRVLVPAVSVLRGVRDARRPDGELVLVDTQAGGVEPLADPTFASLGARHALVYLDGADLAGLA